jgi:branched-chain amino acid aminotransferase
VDEELGVGPSRRHLYFLIASPVGPYFPRGFSPISILVEEEQIRAAPGGVGWVKTGGNYVAGLDGQERARESGFDQILWLDALEHRYLEELNAMNVFLVEEGRLVTPPLAGTILPGVTRRSLLEMAPSLGLDAEERPVAIGALLEGLASGRVSEIFAAGTAAVVTPVGSLGFRGERILVGDGRPGPLARRLHETVTDIQYGRVADERGWMRRVPRRDHEERRAAGVRDAGARELAARP